MSGNVSTIGEIGEIYDGPHATPKRRSAGDHYFLNISSLTQGRLELDKSDLVDQEDFSRWTRRVEPRANDLLFSYETRLGEAALMPSGLRACLGRRMGLIRPNVDVVDPLYLLYFWLSPTFQELIAQRAVHGATVDRILLSELGNWPIELPPLETQRAIAEVLGALDDKIAANHHLSQVIDDLASSLFQKRFKHAPSAPLTSIAKVNTTSISPQSEGEFRYLDISLVGNGTSESPTLTTWAEAPSRARRGVPAGSTIWSTVRPNRRSHCLILDEDPILVASTGFAVLTPSECGPAFLYETTKQKSFQDYLESVAEGSAYPAVRSSEFAKAPVTSATKEERNAFEEEAGPLRALQASLERENQVLASTRDELLPLLMSGRITVGAASSRVEEVV